ncbi:hypothetical protein JCM16303_005037 [Sporobolomyces ruberrimus]
MSSTSSHKPRKTPMLKFDTTYGPAPSSNGKYRSSNAFEKYYRAYQWSKGYDVTVASTIPEVSTTLSCATNPNCSFSITALYHHFTDVDPLKERAILGLKGYRISGSRPQDVLPFVPEHSHDSPYVPMDAELENARRTTLAPGDPTLENPPLVPAPPRQPTTNGTTHASSSNHHGGVNGYANCQGGGGAAGPSTERAPSNLPPPPLTIKSEPVPTTLDQGFTFSRMSPPPLRTTSVSSTSLVGALPTPTPYSSTPSTTPRPSLPPTSQPRPSPPTHSSTPLGQFLLTISPSFLPLLPYLNAAGIPLSTPPSDLLEFDTGHEEDTTIYDLFSEVEGIGEGELALVSDGVWKAKKRKLENSGGGSRLDSRIVIGVPKVKRERWIKRKMEEGKDNRSIEREEERTRKENRIESADQDGDPARIAPLEGR